jgi:hypothetical protein
MGVGCLRLSVGGQLQAQLPGGINLRSAEEMPIFREDGALSGKMSSLLDSVEYYVALQQSTPDNVLPG